jgi:DNA repair exonuclease SbcCD nuclease subunit
MKIVNLNTDIKQFIGIFHIADIHIRLTKRHDEYKKVFDTLISDVLKSPENTCVVIAGDLFHSKSELSPECVQLATTFLKDLADIRPTILFAGNHDATLSNKNRMDSLSPIVSALNHKNLYYLKDTGLYIFGDILFNHMSVFDDVENYIKCSDIPSLYRRQTSHLVALFHGPVDKALTDCGFLVSNRSITVDLFNGHDIALLGDIHTYQNLKTEDGNTDIVYASSLIQQNHGESLDGHGYVIWNLKNKSHLHINVKNEYGFFTININKGKLNTDITKIPKKTRLRVKCFESIPSEVKTVLREIEKHTELLEITYVRVDTEETKSHEITTSLNISDLSSVDFQNKLIHSFLKTKTSDVVLTDEIIKKIYDINKYHNSNLDSDKVVKNIRWKPKKFEFSNMFSYGENNSVDFSKMKDVIGLFAPNTAGKSSLFSALSFCIFDKCDRAFKASHILNSQKMSFSCKFNFEIDNVDYFIERVGKSDKKGNVKVDVKFWKLVDNKIVELNGEARRSTNDLIRDFLGTYDDFILTTLSVQNNKAGSFVDMGQTERKDLLSQFMGLNIFDELYKKSSEKLKELSVELKTLVKSDVGESVEKITSNIESYEEIFYRLEKEYDCLLTDKNNLSNLIIDETKNIVKLDSSVPTDVNSLTKNVESTSKNIVDKTEKIKNLKSEIEEL